MKFHQRPENEMLLTENHKAALKALQDQANASNPIDHDALRAAQAQMVLYETEPCTRLMRFSG